jgi:hypothetical protein
MHHTVQHSRQAAGSSTDTEQRISQPIGRDCAECGAADCTDHGVCGFECALVIGLNLFGSVQIDSLARVRVESDEDVPDIGIDMPLVSQPLRQDMQHNRSAHIAADHEVGHDIVQRFHSAENRLNVRVAIGHLSGGPIAQLHDSHTAGLLLQTLRRNKQMSRIAHPNPIRLQTAHTAHTAPDTERTGQSSLTDCAERRSVFVDEVRTASSDVVAVRFCLRYEGRMTDSSPVMRLTKYGAPRAVFSSSHSAFSASASDLPSAAGLPSPFASFGVALALGCRASGCFASDLTGATGTADPFPRPFVSDI